MSAVAALMVFTVLASAPVAFDSQPGVGARDSDPVRERARIQNQLGWEYLRSEDWTAAAEAFQRAIDIDGEYEYAYYGLGRAELGRRRYPAAIAALEKCGAIYRADAGRQFANAQDAQQYRRDRMLEIDEQLRQLRGAPPNFRTADLIRQLENLKRDLEERLERGNNLNIERHVPAFVTLSLGSAYFRAGRLADAERAYQATVKADPKSGEAYSNLAALYLELERYSDASNALQAARRVGFRVNPQLERAIRDRKKP
jgi:tetratricopeptide (TPR) repeat protein